MSGASSLSPQDAVERGLELSNADGCVVIATERAEANLRWASNSLTTNGEMTSRQLVVISTVGGKTGTAVGVRSRSAVHPDEIESLVRASERAAADSGPAEDAAPLVTPADWPNDSTVDWAEPPAATSIGVFSAFSPELGKAFGRAGAEQRLLFGFAEHVVETAYAGSSTGLRLRHVQPTGRIEVNAKSPDFARSAFVGQQTRDLSDVDVAAIDAELATRLRWAERTVALEPGRYETLLPPSAVADLMVLMYWMAGPARDAEEGRTVFARPGGGTRLGERLGELPVDLYSDPGYAGMQCSPFLLTASSSSMASVFDNGMPLGPTHWIRAGKLNSLVRTRSWAERTGESACGPVDNLIMEAPGATADLSELIGRTQRGLLLTTLWYIRPVDPQTLLVTGLTRDGVYLVEGGEVTAAVNNFRFNDTPVGMLGRIAEVGRTEPTLPRELSDFFTRAAMPTLRIPDFNMSSVSQAS